MTLLGGPPGIKSRSDFIVVGRLVEATYHFLLQSRVFVENVGVSTFSKEKVEE